MEIILMDTDFCFEYLNNNKEATTVLFDNIDSAFMLPFTTHAELLKSCTNSEIMQRLVSRIRKAKLLTIHIDDDISTTALQLIQKFHLSHAAAIPDSLTAAMCLKYDAILATCNKKHFQYIPKLKLLQHNVKPKAGGFFDLM